MAPLRLLGAVAFLLLQVARCDHSTVSREFPLVPGEIEGTPPIKYSPPAGSMPLNGRELVSEWSNTGFLAKRQCVDAGYVPCSDTGCCPSLAQCCPGSNYCKAQSNGVCCGSTGPCPAGYECNSVCRCVETGGSCCANGRYCPAGESCCYSGCVPKGGQCCSNGQMCDVGNICVIDLSNGRYGCCTDLSCTAYVASGNTVPLTHSTPATTAPTHSTPVVTTEAPKVTQPVNAVYIYYYWTLTWSYYSYYYTYIRQVTTLTTTYVTTTTIISAYESDSVAGTSELNRISSMHFSTGFPTPTEATTALAATNRNTPTQTGSSGNGGNNGGSLPGVGVGGVGGGGSVGGAGMVSSLPALTLWAFVMGAVAVGTGMLML
ncbi:hypothetical protein VE00_10130 [Pseudogymnoascus sp. WSF 3629]|nr:hypothetical protein VE00_10130 [Pseudogymnoascus sp. WSF 3629]